MQDTSQPPLKVKKDHKKDDIETQLIKFQWLEVECDEVNDSTTIEGISDHIVWFRDFYLITLL